MPGTALAFALAAAFVHALWNILLARARNPEAATAVALVVAVVVFEDTEAGVASAKAAGMRCLAVLGTLSPNRLTQADEIVPGIDVPLLRRLLG